MRPDSPLGRRIDARLASWKREGLLRTLRPPQGIDLSSNDYLGLSRDPRLVTAFAEAAARDGVGSTGSRLLRGERDAFASVERQFAEFKGAERALYFSSGYLANLAVLTALPEFGDLIFSDALNHASLIDGVRLSRAKGLVFPHLDLAALGAALRDKPCGGIRFVVVESTYSMDGDRAPLSELAALCRAHDALLVVDEAHAIGLYGPRGTGGIEDAGLSHDDGIVSVNTAGKALGVSGAFVAGPAPVVDYLVQRARPFVFSTAPPPAVAAAIAASLAIVGEEPWRRERTLHLAHHLRRRLASAGVAAPGDSQIVPVLIGDNDKAVAVADRLNAAGFDVRAIRPPSVPERTARLRISINAGLDEDTLDRFARRLIAAIQEAGLCSAVSS